MGYPSNIVFVSTLDCYTCVVCHDVMKDPTSCKECGHTFCRQCIETCLSSSSTDSCPSCRVTVTGTNPNFVARDMIDSLQVKCVHHCCVLDDDDNNINNNDGSENNKVDGDRNKKRRRNEDDDDDDDSFYNKTDQIPQKGCKWIGPLKDLQNHQEQCEWETITCPTTDGCNFRCKRRDMDTHLTSGTGILRHMELMKSSYETKLSENEQKMRAMEKKLLHERNHFKYLNDCRSWIDHKSDVLLSADFKVHQIKERNISTSDVDVTGLYCSIPGPTKSNWDGAMIPLLIKYDNTTGPPMCRFPKGFLHPNVYPSGSICTKTYLEWNEGTKFTLPEFLFIIQRGLCRYEMSSPAQLKAYTMLKNEPLEYPKKVREEARKYKNATFSTDIYTKKVVFDPEYIDLNHEFIVPMDIVGVAQDLFTRNNAYEIVRPIINERRDDDNTNKNRLLEIMYRLNDDSEAGSSIQECMTALPSMSEVDMRQAMHLLSEEGHVYSTISEHYFKVAP